MDPLDTLLQAMQGGKRLGQLIFVAHDSYHALHEVLQLVLKMIRALVGTRPLKRFQRHPRRLFDL